MGLISLICWILAASCNSVMDTLSHHYSTSIFINFRNYDYWNPVTSWRNKYKHGNKDEGPAFFLSTGLLVAFTDGWHLFKSMMIVLLAISVVTFPYTYKFCLFDNIWLNMTSWVLIYGTMWNSIFSLMYKRILIR